MSTVETDLTISEIEANTLTAKNNTAANKTKNENILSKISGLETKLNTIITKLQESSSPSSGSTETTATDTTATATTATDSTTTDTTATDTTATDTTATDTAATADTTATDSTTTDSTTTEPAVEEVAKQTVEEVASEADPATDALDLGSGTKSLVSQLTGALSAVITNNASEPTGPAIDQSDLVGFSWNNGWGGGGCQFFTAEAMKSNGTPDTVSAADTYSGFTKNTWTTYFGANLSNQLSQQIIRNTYPVIKLYGTTSDAASDYQFPSDITTDSQKIQYCKDIVAGTRELEVAGFTGDIYNTWKTTYYKMVDTVSSYTPRYSSRTLLYVLILCLIVYMFFVINKKQIKKIVKQ